MQYYTTIIIWELFSLPGHLECQFSIIWGFGVHIYEVDQALSKETYLRFVKWSWFFKVLMMSLVFSLPSTMSAKDSVVNRGHELVISWQNDAESVICTGGSIRCLLLPGMPIRAIWVSRENDEQAELITSSLTSFWNSRVSSLISGHIAWSPKSLSADQESSSTSSSVGVLSGEVC